MNTSLATTTEKTTTSIISHSPNYKWLTFFSPVKAVEAVANHIAGLPSSRTPEKHTMRSYERGLKYFLSWITRTPFNTKTPIMHYASMPFPIPSADIMQEFIGHLTLKGRKVSTINSKYLAPTRRFIKSLSMQVIANAHNIHDFMFIDSCRMAMKNTLDLPLPKPENKTNISSLYAVGERLADWQVDKLFASLMKEKDESGEITLKALRDLALIYTGLISALRVSEIGRITLASIKPYKDDYTITVRGKNGQHDPVALSTTGYNLITAYVNKWNNLLDDDDPRRITDETPIWQPTRANKPEQVGINGYDPTTGISRHAIANLIKSRGNHLINVDLSPHDLRRTYAARAYEAKIPIYAISLQLRHQNIATTIRYIGNPEDHTEGLNEFDLAPETSKALSSI